MAGSGTLASAATVFLARFVFGLRIIAGPMAGVLRMPWKKFLTFNFVGAAVWVGVISGVGYLFGRHWEQMENAIKRFDLAVAIGAGVVMFLLWWWNRRKAKAAPSE